MRETLDAVLPLISGGQDGFFDGFGVDGVADGVAADGVPSDGSVGFPLADGTTGADGAVVTPTDTTGTTPNMAPDANPTAATDLGQLASDQAQQADAANQLSQIQGNANTQILAATQAAGYDPNHVAIDTGTNQLHVLNPDGTLGQPLAQMQPNGTFVPMVPDPANPGSFIPQNLAQGATTTGNAFVDALNAAVKPLSTFLQTPAGKLAGALGAGALGMGAAALLGQPSKVPNSIRLTPNAATVQSLLGAGQGAALAGLQKSGNLQNPGSPGTSGAEGLQEATTAGLSGQGTLADLLNLQAGQTVKQQNLEQPLEELVGLNAVSQLPGQMNATTNPNITGTAKLGQAENTLAQGQVGTQGDILSGIGGQIKNVLNGQYSNPILENQIKLQKDAFNAKMYAQLGPGWETSTAGQEAQEQENLYETSTRFQDQQSTLANYTPLYNASFQNTVGNQQSATGQVQQAQAQGVQQNAQLSQMGKTPTGSLATGLTSITPTPTLSGLASAAQTQSQLISSQQQSNMANTANTNALNNTLATQAGNVINAGLGTLAG